MYTFNKVVRKQNKGGAIGLKVTQALARLYMVGQTVSCASKTSRS